MSSDGTDSIAEFIAGWRAERPDLDPSPLAIMGRTQRVTAHLMRHSDTWLAPLGLTWETFSVIASLRRAGEPFQMNPTELQRMSLLTSGAMTNRIDRVEEQGLVARLPDPVDGRGVIVRLTPQGRALADKAIAAHFEGLADVLGVLPATERRELGRLLGKLLLALEGAAPAAERTTRAAARKRAAP
jgi:DNA-binding MarR family transcriptional regulator